MNVQTLKFYHFRNYENASFSFEPNCIHVLYGNNAQGKTNVIEAIYFLSLLRSFRTNHLQNVIQYEEDSFIIAAQVESKGRREDLKIVVSESKKHLYRFNNSVPKYSSFIGIVNAILFCPDDLNLFSQSPRYRRKFIDMELIKLSKTYTSTLSHYQKLLKERNQALKQYKVDEALVHIYTMQMIEDEKIILLQRNQFIRQWIEKVKQIYPLFSEDDASVDAIYETFVSLDANLDENLKLAYEKSKSKDFQYKTTSVGIHKDDIIFTLNGMPIVEIASQGQKRSVLLALKIALAQIIYEKSGQYPILLLDDVFSELDIERRKRFVQMLPKQMQIFITTTERMDLDWFDRPVKFYKVENGKMEETIL